jgi:signal peptidase I
MIRPYIVQAFYMPSLSMQPTLEENDRFLINKLTYLFESVKHGDIILFDAPREAVPVNNQHVQFIKRVMALPGDTIEVRGGYITVDGNRYDHSELRTALQTEGRHRSLKIGRNGIYVAGKRISPEAVASAVGSAGKKVEFHPGVVICNGKRLDEPYMVEDPDSDFAPMKIKSGTVFVIGDNLNNSSDSRMWGTLPFKAAHGKATLRYWPLERLGQID